MCEITLEKLPKTVEELKAMPQADAPVLSPDCRNHMQASRSH